MQVILDSTVLMPQQLGNVYIPYSNKLFQWSKRSLRPVVPTAPDRFFFYDGPLIIAKTLDICNGCPSQPRSATRLVKDGEA